MFIEVLLAQILITLSLGINILHKVKKNLSLKQSLICMFIYAIVQRYFSASRRAVQNTVLYAVIGLAGLSAIFIITAGVYIRRMRRWVLVWFQLPPRNAPSPNKNVLPD